MGGPTMSAMNEFVEKHYRPTIMRMLGIDPDHPMYGPWPKYCGDAIHFGYDGEIRCMEFAWHDGAHRDGSATWTRNADGTVDIHLEDS